MPRSRDAFLQVGATFGSQVVSEAVRPYAGEAGRRVPVRTILPARSRGGLARNLEPPGSRLPGAEVAVDDRLEPRDFERQQAAQLGGACGIHRGERRGSPPDEPPPAGPPCPRYQP